MTASTTPTSVAWWRRPVGVETLINIAAIVVLPVVALVLYPPLAERLRGLGFTQLVESFSRTNPFTDIGWEIAAARALVDRAHSMYDSTDVLGALIGMNAYDVGTHTHPPTSVVPWIPLGFVPYSWWLPFFVVSSVVAIAVSMRVLNVAPWLAYPTAIVVALTPVGQFALTTTYPLSALVLACAWRFRDHPWIAGPAYAFLTAARGVSGLLLLYPLVRRQWRTFLIGLGLVVALAVVAVVLEPDSVSGFLDRGMASIRDLQAAGYLYTPDAIASRAGLPGWTAWLVCVVVAVAAAWWRRNVFWSLAWLAFAVSSLAWAWSAIAVIPLVVVIAQSGRIGRVLAILTAGISLGSLAVAPVGGNVLWPFVLAMTAIGLLTCRLEPPVSIPQRQSEAAL